MKKTFEQLWKWILKHKKELIYGALALFIGQICFFNLWWLGVGNEVFAAGDTPSLNSDFQKRATGWLQSFSFLNRWCYILLYPILFLAWILVNNSFVYAEVFGFDAVLWQLWNVVRNLANYALWFILLFKIFQFLTSGQKSADMKKLLTSTLIAWIWIQASWFLLAVLIDVSNVLTYSVWWLPIHILWKQKSLWESAENFWNPFVYQTAVSFNFDDSDTLHTYLVTTWTGDVHFIAECETFSYTKDGKVEQLIIAPEIVYYYDWKTYHNTEQLKCHVWDDVFNLAGFAKGIDWQDSANPTWKDSQNKYKTSVEKAINLIKGWDEDVMWLVSAWKVLQIRNAHWTWDNKDPDVWVSYEGDPKKWLDVNNEVNWKSWNMSRLQGILDGEDGYVWVFSALYSSLLNAGKDFRIEDAWIYTSLLNTLLSFCHIIAVGIPLVAMLIVFLMRIGVIWMAIVLSPAIILVKAFGREEKIKKMDLLKYLTVSNLIGIIFSPAIICFAVSISTVLVRIISTVNAEGIIAKSTSLFWWFIELNIASAWVSIWKLICSVIWIAISWFLIRSAVKASALWEKVQWLEKLAKSAIWSIPIIPVPWVNWEWVSHIWIDKAFGLNGQTWIFSDVTRSIKSKYTAQDQAALQGWLNWQEGVENAVENRRVAYVKKLEDLNIADIKSWVWTTMTQTIWEGNDKMNLSFLDFDNWDRKKIIEAINGIENVDKRLAFGDSLKEIIVWNDKYIFNGTSNKYELQSNNAPASAS